MANGWSLDIGDYSKKTISLCTDVIRKIAFDLSSSIILDTPVDTGRARGNWIPSIGSASSAILYGEDKSGLDTISNVGSTINQWKPNSPFYLVNNLPYINELEDGSSDKAPNGMVAINVARFGLITDQAVREV